MHRVGSKSVSVLIFFSGLMGIRWQLAAPVNEAIKFFALYCLIAAPVFFDEDNAKPLLFLNLAGLPPMTGFFMKISILQSLTFSLAFTLLFGTVFLLFRYIRSFLYRSKSDHIGLHLLVCLLGPFTL